MVVFRRAAGPDSFGCFRINGFFPLGFPVQLAAGVRHAVILFPRVRNAFGNIRRVGRDLAGNDALFHIVHVGQRQMFRRRNIAQKCRPAHSRHRAADRCGDVIVARSNIRDQRPQHIKRRALADGLLYFHVGRDLVQGHMTRPFHHHLHVFFPGPLGQFAQTHQLFDLALIRGIRQTARTAGVPQADGHIMFPADFQDLIIVFIKRIFFPRHAHPGKDETAAPAHKVHFPLSCANLFNGLARNAAVQGYKIHAVFRVQADYVNKISGR